MSQSPPILLLEDAALRADGNFDDLDGQDWRVQRRAMTDPILLCGHSGCDGAGIVIDREGVRAFARSHTPEARFEPEGEMVKAHVAFAGCTFSFSVMASTEEEALSVCKELTDLFAAT